MASKMQIETRAACNRFFFFYSQLLKPFEFFRIKLYFIIYTLYIGIPDSNTKTNFFFFSFFVTVNLANNGGRVDMTHFDLLKVLGTGGKIKNWIFYFKFFEMNFFLKRVRIFAVSKVTRIDIMVFFCLKSLNNIINLSI